MGVKVASSCLNWTQTVVPHSPSSCQQALASSIASPSSRRGSYCNGAGTMVCRYVHRLNQSTFVGYSSSKLCRTGSFEHRKSRSRGGMTRVCSATASFDSFSDEEFSLKIQELALKFHLSNDDDEEEKSGENNAALNSEQDIVAEEPCETRSKFLEVPNAFESLEPPNWTESDEMILDNVERKANSLELPLSLRIIKRKKQWEESVQEASDLAYCSVKKAFSSMVFIIKELHSYTLQMREMLFFEDLQGILARVQTEIQASFVWLFQQVFSHTPTLMVSVMILLANYSVYSMANNAAIAAAPPTQSYAAKTEMVSMVDDQSYYGKQKFDPFSVSSSSGKVASIGGNNGCGGKYPPVASGTGGEGSFERASNGPIVPDGASYTVKNPSRTGDEQSISEQLSKEQELTLWNSVVDEASKMQAAMRDEALDHEIMLKFVSPINTKIESDIYEYHHKTEMLYQMGLAEDPSNPLLLTNYAQFLHLVNQDHDRAEEYFKKAVKVIPKDAEALNKYANFLWTIKKDLWAAEQTYLEAIDADPGNSYYASSYAHFLWNTGGEDTCYPI